MPVSADLRKIISEFSPDQEKFQYSEIMESLRYARLIQQALLPRPESIHKLLKDYFILNIPKYVVSGDFYWISQKNEQIYLLAADCTGHGIPGALMSILGITLLSEVIRNDSSRQSNRILNSLRERVMDALHQTGEFNESKDGMDLSLCIIDHKENYLQYSGANNPLYIIRDDTLMEIKGDKMPIGINAICEEPFSVSYIEICKNDRLYMFSDGFPDQFGGPDGKKFKYRPFKKLLIDIHRKSMREQQRILKQTIKKWAGDNEQVDDILVIGHKITQT
jgi:serine phosphatase RsbU (regulator of sigma subunit)